MRDPDFLVFGCERSGTTLLSALLTEHSGICALNDTCIFKGFTDMYSPLLFKLALKMFARLIPLPQVIAAAETGLLTRFPDYLGPKVANRYRNNLRRIYLGQGENDWRRQYAERLVSCNIRKRTPSREVLALTFGQLIPGNQRNKKMIGEKTPVHSHIASWLESMYPDARMIVLIRHPVTNVAAIAKRRGSLRKAIALYASYYEISLQALMNTSDARVYVIRYEDLVYRTPEAMGLDILSGFLIYK